MVQVQAHEEAAKGMTTLPDPIGAVTLAPPSMLCLSCLTPKLHGRA
jgi:hypothetical protein